MNKKKTEQKRKKRGLLTTDEHFQRRAERQLINYQKNPKNKNKKPFTSA